MGNLSSTHYAQNRPKSCATLPVRLKIGEPLQNRTRHVGEALSLPKLTQQSGSVIGNCQRFLSSWLPPGGSWIFWQAALRNRLAKKPDEGRREVGSQMQLYEWHLFRLFPFNVESSNFFSYRHPSSVSPAGSEVPSWLTASPRGKPRGANHRLNPHNAAGCSISSCQ